MGVFTYLELKSIGNIAVNVVAAAAGAAIKLAERAKKSKGNEFWSMVLRIQIRLYSIEFIIGGVYIKYARAWHGLPFFFQLSFNSIFPFLHISAFARCISLLCVAIFLCCAVWYANLNSVAYRNHFFCLVNFALLYGSLPKINICIYWFISFMHRINFSSWHFRFWWNG